MRFVSILFFSSFFFFYRQLLIPKMSYTIDADLDSQSASHNHYPLMQWVDLPGWRRDNEYIISGYRRESTSFRKSLASWKYIHNETVNIYSHLFGTVLFLGLFIFICLFHYYPMVQANDRIMFMLFFCGMIICFLFSASFHTISNHSEATAALGNQLDYLGIVLCMWGAIASAVYYCFYCDKYLQIVYWIVLSTVALASTFTTFSPAFRSPALRLHRTAMYAALGLLPVVFIIHGLALYGLEMQKRRMSLVYLMGTAALNIIGAVVYVTRIPERLYGRRFDIWCQSHQIMHFMVIFSGLTYMFGLLKAAEFVHSRAHQC
jgi:adiponectin receptor